MRAPMADAWDFLTKTPESETPTNSPMKGKLATVDRDGCSFRRWQHKPTMKSGARIWFYVDGRPSSSSRCTRIIQTRPSNP